MINLITKWLIIIAAVSAMIQYLSDSTKISTNCETAMLSMVDDYRGGLTMVMVIMIMMVMMMMMMMVMVMMMTKMLIIIEAGSATSATTNSTAPRLS